MTTLFAESNEDRSQIFDILAKYPIDRPLHANSVTWNDLRYFSSRVYFEIVNKDTLEIILTLLELSGNSTQSVSLRIKSIEETDDYISIVIDTGSWDELEFVNINKSSDYR